MSTRAAPLVALLVACSGPPAPTPPRGPSEPAAGGERRASEPRDDTRALGPEASFSDLLDSARRLDDRREQDSSSGCLLRPGFRLEADLAVAVRPLPRAPDDLDEALAHHPGPVNVLSRWGAYGRGEPNAPSFAAVTSTLPPRREPALVWAITDRGVYVRSTRDAAPQPDPMDAEALAPTLPSETGALFVTAEAAIPLERVARVLALVPDSLAGRVALAVALAPGTRLPQPPGQTEHADAGAGLCADGGPSELAEDAPTGDLRPETLVQRLAPLRRSAEACVSGTQGPGAAGGRVVLALRIGPDGAVTEACAAEDSTGDPVLRTCLLRAARTLAFDVPSPPGFVDVELPLVLAPVASQRQVPLCR